MNRQVFDLLHTLMTHKGKSFHLSTLARDLEVSVRTIRNYSAQIHRFLDARGLSSLYSSSNAKLCFNGTDEQSELVAKLIMNANFYEYKLSAKERQNIITFVLLCSDEPVTLAQFESLLFVSRGTLIGDLADVTTGLNEWNIHFCENKNYGFVIKCNESTRRSALLRMINKMGYSTCFSEDMSPFDIRIGFLQRLLKLEKYRVRVEHAIRAAEHHFHLTLSDFDFNDMMLTLCISLSRLENNHMVEAPLSYDFPSTSFAVNFSEYIFRRLQTDIPYREEEIQFLAEKLHTKRLFSSIRENGEEQTTFFIVVKSFLYHLSLAYNIDFLHDIKLQEYLTGHIFGVYHRITDNQKLINPFREEIIRDNYKDYCIIKENINVLEDGLGCTFSDDEISYILMHIIAGLERIIRSFPIPNVIIACNTGLGTANFLAEMVKKNFNVQIVSITSTHNIQMLLTRQQCDLIISTIPLHDVPVQWIQVNPILNQKDIAKIRGYLSNIARLRMHSKQLSFPSHEFPAKSPPYAGEQELAGESDETYEKNLHFSDLLLPGHILIDKRPIDWKEAIIVAGEPMLWNKKISFEYLEAMVNNVLENGPYIVFAPGVAIAHAHPKYGILDVSATFLRLAEPICFGHHNNDPVRFVVTLAMTTTTRYVSTLFNMMNTLCNPVAAKKLSRAVNHQQVLSILREYESNVPSLS